MKAELSRTGEQRENKEGRLLISDSVFLFFLFFFSTTIVLI